MDVEFMKKVEKDFVKRDTDVTPGDTVKVHLRITEAGKERTQVFEGVVIAIKGAGLSKSITVRKMSHGVGVEKIIPVNSPIVKKIDVVTRGNVRRSKLYYMRGKVGKRSLDVAMDEGFEGIWEEDETEEPDTSEKEKEKPEDKPTEKKKKSEGKEERKPPKEEKPEMKDDDSKKDQKKDTN